MLAHLKSEKKIKEIFQDSETAQRGKEECKIGGYFSGWHQLSGNLFGFCSASAWGGTSNMFSTSALHSTPVICAA